MLRRLFYLSLLTLHTVLFVLSLSNLGEIFTSSTTQIFDPTLELVSKELNHLAAILHVYAGV